MIRRAFDKKTGDPSNLKSTIDYNDGCILYEYNLNDPFIDVCNNDGETRTCGYIDICGSLDEGYCDYIDICSLIDAGGTNCAPSDYCGNQGDLDPLCNTLTDLLACNQD